MNYDAYQNTMARIRELETRQKEIRTLLKIRGVQASHSMLQREREANRVSLRHYYAALAYCRGKAPPPCFFYRGKVQAIVNSITGKASGIVDEALTWWAYHMDYPLWRGPWQRDFVEAERQIRSGLQPLS